MSRGRAARGWPLLWLLLAQALSSGGAVEPASGRLAKYPQLNRPLRGFAELHKLMKQGHGACDLDRICEWSWKNDTFERVTPDKVADQYGPLADASSNHKGQFLWLAGNVTSQMWSKVIPRAGANCYLELSVFQIENTHGKISFVIETDNGVNKTYLIAHERVGNNTARWEKMKINLGDRRQDFRILIEVKLAFDNSSIAFDNIQLVQCFPDQRTFSREQCTDMMFRCRNGSCLKREHVCDFTIDCPDGEDENDNCDKMPQESRCNFESGWCKWENLNEYEWKLGRGPANKQRTGPHADHTYRNATGTYAYVEMSNGGSMGSEAVLKSPMFNPMPPYHSNTKSPYVNSCKVRFVYYQVDMSTLALALWLVKQLPHNQTSREKLFWSSKNTSGRWQAWTYPLPDSRTKYFLLFEAVKGYGSNGLVAIDDFSLSPECFGLGVPPSVVGDWNYYDQKMNDIPPKHPDFTNASLIVIDTCSQTGRLGPTPELCSEAHNRTDVEILSESSVDKGDAAFRSKGIQRWIAPRGGYYTIIATGARGGKGALATGISLGAMVKGIAELVKGQQLYFMVGQPGTDACQKKLGARDDACQKTKSNFTFDKIHEVKKTELSDGGGGGGGATYVFTLKENGEQLPLLIAGGGGGLGSTQFHDDQQDGKGLLTGNRKPVNGTSFRGNAGGGAGWLPGTINETNDVKYGMALAKGGVGGVGCSPNQQGFGDGGFGGGGGGCLSGGGGGGYAGGDTGHEPSGNGAGGYSYAYPDLMEVVDAEKQNSGPGEVFVIPEIQGCGCDYRCMAFDQYLSETRCICPAGWHLSNNQKSCIPSDDERDPMQKKIMIFMGVVSIALIVAISFLCLLLYNRYQARKVHQMKHRAFFPENGTELRTVSDQMLSEFNPNYDFVENLYCTNSKELKTPIPREQIKLIKSLGQGAFGEVFQGIYRHPAEGDREVAVKTLPVTSTPQAEADFIMEALIMSKFNHPNIVQFIGISFSEHPRYIVLELLSGGDLKNFLREERPRSDLPTSLTMKDLLRMALDVAYGCRYMQEHRFIHRDIAARNCLLTTKGPGRNVKVADFGMARDIYRSEYYKKGGSAMLPIKWMPPESFIDGIFTSKTDVWAFGVLLWEIMSFGYMPYTGCSNREVVTLVAHGGRLEKPAGCPDPVYGLMLTCWHPNADARPDFEKVVSNLNLCLQDPDVLSSPMPSFDILPLSDREITIPNRHDSETECIDIQAGLDKHGYMQPRVFYRPKTEPSRAGSDQKDIVYAALKHEEDLENCNECKSSPSPDYTNSVFDKQHGYAGDELCDNRDKRSREENGEPNANVVEPGAEAWGTEPCRPGSDGQNGNGESTTTTDSGTPPERRPAGRGEAGNGNAELGAGANGVMIRESSLKAALSLDPNALCNRVIPYEKIGFGPGVGQSGQLSSGPGSTELSEVGLRREECSC